MLTMLEHTSSVWALAVVVLGTIVHQVVRLLMFKAALRNSKPAERPAIITALAGLLGRGPFRKPTQRNSRADHS
ncbi:MULTISPECIES: hypothetical protein [unclassified Amycolatopsis]|uniref:hypothetical protein n=1 Tax=unclassified Amycolatopsis TaxID=2618356 RepID=UPI0028759A6B|nr:MULTISPECIES: hypothetical protein [unclassified Amycolatopsis]MDS0138591.1 hypothetical protein [Amycolatopsis sp. 505]MDS0146132.1 hypothetical protein [Amycolatopsis sp. CM201R]